MDKKDMRAVQNWLLRRALEPLQEMIERGDISSGEGITFLSQQSGTFVGENDTPGYRRFKGNTSLIYAGEQFFESAYGTESGMFEYKFRPPSLDYQNTLFKLYQQLSGKGYESPEQLRDLMKEALEGRRVLELGSGPGFNLKVLKDLGANVSGVEIRRDLAEGVPEADVRLGDAQDLDTIFDNEQFDVIYSRDLFCLDVVLNRQKSARVVQSTARHTKNGGLGLHQVTYEKMQPLLYHFSRWVAARETGRDFETMQRDWDMLSDEEQEDLMHSNRCSLDPQDLLRIGFRVMEYSAENGDLNIVAKK